MSSNLFDDILQKPANGYILILNASSFSNYVGLRETFKRRAMLLTNRVMNENISDVYNMGLIGMFVELFEKQVDLEHS